MPVPLTHVYSLFDMIIFWTCKSATSSVKITVASFFNHIKKLAIYPQSEKISPLLQNLYGSLSIGESCTRLLHYVILYYLALVLNSGLMLLMFTPLLDPCTLPSGSYILSTPNVKVNSYGQRSFACHALYGILCHLHSYINRNLIAWSELLKLICFISINEFNTTVVFCYFYFHTINTTLVINKLRHLTVDINVIIMLFSQSLFHLFYGTQCVTY